MLEEASISEGYGPMVYCSKLFYSLLASDSLSSLGNDIRDVYTLEFVKSQTDARSLEPLEARVAAYLLISRRRRPL